MLFPSCFLFRKFKLTFLLLSGMYFDGGEMVIGASIDLVNRRKEARGHFWAPPGIKVINKRIESRVANIRWLAGELFLSLLK